MKFEFKIALRYLFSKKRHNAINVISFISICGIALATLTLVCTLSVFNGFQESVASLFTAFDPELKITPAKGKLISTDSTFLKLIDDVPFLDRYTVSLEENAMVKFRDKQSMVTLKGVDKNYHRVTAINTLLVGDGAYKLSDNIVNYGILGVELAGMLSTGVSSPYPMEVFVPKQGRVNMANPSSSFNKGHLYSPGVLFAVNQTKYDAHYIICSLDFVRQLYGYDKKATAIELKLQSGADITAVQHATEKLLGDDFAVLNRYEQQTDIFNIMKVEKLISYFFLSFIVLIASFNIISSLSMLIIEKKEDMQILINMGATKRQIAKIFLLEGQIITIIGTSLGLLLGVILVLLQQYFGFISLSGGGQFITSSYPVSLQVMDLLLIELTVIIVGFTSVAYPIRYLSRKILV